MIRFKHFLKINEELNDNEKAEVATWPQRTAKATKATDHYFGKGVEDKHTPLEGTHNKSEIHHAIERHLGKEITQDEYKSGQTKDEHGRPTRIGKLLNKTKAPDELSRGFENDSTRQGKKFSGLSVRTTRSAAGVAGQTSRGQSWEQQSCKNFNTGINRKYLKPDVKNGAVVHYLHDENGKEIARSTAQPYTNDAGHTIYKSDSYYGIDHKGFKDHVEKANKELSGEHKGGSVVYTKNKQAYDNDGNHQEVHPNATKDHLIDELDKTTDKSIKRKIIHHPNTPSDILDKIQKGSNEDDKATVASSPHATTKHLDNALNDTNSDIARIAAGNHNMNSTQLHKAINHPSNEVRSQAVLNPNLKSEHIDKVLKDKERFDPVTTSLAVQHHNATQDHIKQGLAHESQHVRSGALQNKNITLDHLRHAIKDPTNNASTKRQIMFHDKADKELASKGLEDPDEFTQKLAKNKLSKMQ